MSGVIKRRGDEGQRGKERWRTEGDGRKKKSEREGERERDGDEVELALYYSRLDITQEHFYGIKKMSVPFLSQGLFLISNSETDVLKKKKNIPRQHGCRFLKLILKSFLNR